MVRGLIRHGNNQYSLNYQQMKSSMIYIQSVFWNVASTVIFRNYDSPNSDLIQRKLESKNAKKDLFKPMKTLMLALKTFMNKDLQITKSSMTLQKAIVEVRKDANQGEFAAQKFEKLAEPPKADQHNQNADDLNPNNFNKRTLKKFIEQGFSDSIYVLDQKDSKQLIKVSLMRDATNPFYFNNLSQYFIDYAREQILFFNQPFLNRVSKQNS